MVIKIIIIIFLVCGQYINVYKLGANWNGHDFENHKSWSQQILIFKL
jgi:hypothetical protein